MSSWPDLWKWAVPDDTDGRTVPPAPMPPALAATIDLGKRDSPGPVDTPEALAARVRTLEEARARTPRLPAPQPEETPR